MTVLGLGLDVVAVRDFAELLETGSSFSDQVFTTDELATAAGLPGVRRDQHLAARFAAKEAFVKAWSAAAVTESPLVPPTQTWAGVEVRTDVLGRPSLTLRGRVREAVEESVGPLHIHVSLTHEPAYAAAVVLLDRPLDVGRDSR